MSCGAVVNHGGGGRIADSEGQSPIAGRNDGRAQSAVLRGEVTPPMAVLFEVLLLMLQLLVMLLLEKNTKKTAATSSLLG